MLTSLVSCQINKHFFICKVKFSTKIKFCGTIIFAWIHHGFQGLEGYFLVLTPCNLLVG